MCWVKDDDDDDDNNNNDDDDNGDDNNRNICFVHNLRLPRIEDHSEL